MDYIPIEKIGVFGGSFDPVHIGHLIVAQDALEQLELDRLIFVPASTSPHKLDRESVDGQHRLEMLKLATENNFRFEVSDMELERGGISYTYDTIQRLKYDHPGAHIFFIIGLDSLVDFHQVVALLVVYIQPSAVLRMHFQELTH